MALTRDFARQLAEYLEFGGDPVRAGSNIQAFADQHGDASVPALIDGLSDFDLSNILRQYDLTFTSPIQQAVSPERFAALVEMEHKYAAGDYAELRGMLTGVLFAESGEPSDDRAVECLDAVVGQPHAVELLAGMLLKHAEHGILNFWLYGSFLVAGTNPDNDLWLNDCLNGYAPPDIDAVRNRSARSMNGYSHSDFASEDADTRSGMADGDLQQLCWYLREYHEDFFLDVVLHILRDMARHHVQSGGA